MSARAAREVINDFIRLYDTIEASEITSSSEAPPSPSDVPNPPVWRRLPKSVRAILFGLILSRKYPQQSYAFSVNCNPHRFDDAPDVVAKIMRDMNNALRKRGLSDIAFFIGLHSTRGNRREIHFHGSAIVSPNSLAEFKEVLRSVAGVWRPGGRRERQLHCEQRYGDTAWENYVISESAPTRSYLLDELRCTSGRTIGMSQSATRIVHEEFTRVCGLTEKDMEFIGGRSSLTDEGLDLVA